MAEVEESNEDDAKDFGDVRRSRAPSKKKFDDEMEQLCATIRKTEDELKSAGASSFTDGLKGLRAEKNANIERRKKIDADLQKLNKDISEMMHNISRLESTLHYRSEDKIDEAIRRLEWNLKVQNFKLSQEKKIVAEIDSLRRSKKTLMQYLSMKKDKDAMRDKQRRMREERDYYFHKVTELKQKEEKLRGDNMGQKAKAERLKKELDKLYEAKRQMVQVYKKQREEFFDDRDKRRHESFKKRHEEKQAIQAAIREERKQVEVEKAAVYDDEICLCNTLLHYLQRFVSNTDLDSSLPGVTVTPATAAITSPSEEAPPSAVGPAEELEDGQYVLLRKSDDDNYVSCSAKHAARKNRRSRKPSMVKRINHTPEVLSHFLKLNLNAPTTVAEILASLEQLRARKLHYEREAEERSELSVTESSILEMSRQASHTESNDGFSESRPGDYVVEQLLELSVSDNSCFQGHDPDHSHSPEVEGQGKVRGRNSFDSVEMNYLATADPSEDFPSLSSRSDGLDFSQSRSRSEGLDFTPLSSLTGDGAWGGTEEGQGRSPGKDLDAECDQCEGKDGRPTSSESRSRGEWLSRHTSQRSSNCEESSDLAGKPCVPGPRGSTETPTTAASHIRRVENGIHSATAGPSKSWRVCDRSTPATSSLEEFPALISGKGSDAALLDFLVSGKVTDPALLDGADHIGDDVRAQGKDSTRM
ncbi:uncharacterized protein [Littorina saxatilis]|uniref:uncharacterized protein n=1 Tax=Littorina saxatilis TaxID=31220 RepID=UPI0038B5560B